MRRALVVLAVMTLAACQTTQDSLPPPEPPPTALPALTPLPAGILFDGRLILPPPPAAGSSAERADLAIAQGPWSAERVELARQDNVINPFAAFDDVLGADFAAARFPATAALLGLVASAAGPASQPPKDLYGRARPFMRMEGHPTCVDGPSLEILRHSPAYPSGHSAIGFAWGLTLAQLLPARTDALIARGVDFGTSRVVCGVHWQSDVEAGRLIGAAAFARLQSEDTFQQALASARTELEAAYTAPR